MEISGFIYLWFDRRRKMYYIGCHWGHEWDGYICSSNRMRDAYYRRREDFKRRIIQRNIPRENLLEEEFKWLSMIKPYELGRKYYNHSKKHFGHWTNLPDEEKKLTIKEKLSRAAIGRTHDKSMTPEQREIRAQNISKTKNKLREKRLALGLPIRAKEKNPRPSGYTQSEEIKQKKSETMKRLYKDGDWKPWSAGKTLGPQNPERIEKRASKLRGKKRSDEQRQTISEANKESWASGKFANRKSNNMKDFIWVHFKETKKNTRILSRNFDPSTMNRGRSPRTEDSYGI